MTTFIKMKFKKSDDQTNIDKYRVAANITAYLIISKFIFLRIIIIKFLKIKQLFRYYYIVASLSTRYLTDMDVRTDGP